MRPLSLVVLLSVVFLASLPGAARAQGPSTSPATTARPAKERSPVIAGALSFGVPATLVGVGWYIHETGDTRGAGDQSGWAAAVIIPSLVLGPSVGHWYAGEVGWMGLALRAGGAAATYQGLVLWQRNSATVGGTMFGVGLAAGVIGVGFDLITAPAAARRYNARQARQAALAPWVRDGGTGVVVAGQF
jgi:hypothetical protein